jgi:hypothetical protein
VVANLLDSSRTKKEATSVIPEAVDLWIPVTGIGSGVRGEAIEDCAGIVQCFRGDLICNMRLLPKGDCNDVSYYMRRMCLLGSIDISL